MPQPDGANAGSGSTGVTLPGTESVPGTDLSYFLMAFDEKLQERSIGAVGKVSALVDQAIVDPTITDVILFSHGWRGDLPAAREQYSGWIGAMAGLASDRARAVAVQPGFHPLLIGLHWPSEPWGDESMTPVSFSAPDQVLVEDYVARLGTGSDIREQLEIIEQETNRADRPAKLPSALVDAYEKLDRALNIGNEGVSAAPGQDRAESFDPEMVYEEAKPKTLSGAGPSFGVFNRNILLDPLRTLSFWKMKDRARQFGELAVNPMLVNWLDKTKSRNVRFHLMGHSFGCIVASAAVAGAPESTVLPRPVQSMSLIQGALSIWAYCSGATQTKGQPGYFQRIFSEARIAGPVVTTQSRFDSAVGTWYPRAAMVKQQVSYGPILGAAFPKYGAIGSFGIQGPDLKIQDQDLQNATETYDFSSAKIFNLESSAVICNGKGVSGAHSDIRKPEVAHAVWSAILA